MCGVAGYFLAKTQSPAHHHWIRDMGQAIRHRGPDQQGHYQSEHFAFTNQRLAIIDPQSAPQPIFTPDQRYGIVFNGEIYNYQNLRQELVQLGYTFSTHTDTEVILYLFIHHGIDCLRKLEGMFAFAIWDSQQEELFLARDPLGIKPLFLHKQDGHFAFASEIKALLTLPWIEARPHLCGIADYLFCSYCLEENTFFQDITCLLPGHALLLNAQEQKSWQYWDICFANSNSQTQDALRDELFAQIQHNVARELHSDTPVGSCLSGGLDSSIVSALAAPQIPQLPTFSIGYPANTELFGQHKQRIIGEIVGDDWHYAQVMADNLDCQHHAYSLCIDPLLQEIDHMIRQREKPLITLSEFGHSQLAKKSAQHVKVLLSGQGSDEIFGGYYYWWQYRQQTEKQHFPWVFRSAPGQDPSTAIDFLISLLRPDFPSQAEQERQQLTYQRQWQKTEGTDDFNRISYLLVKNHLHEMLELEDRHGMAASLEIRVPFLNHHLVQWALNLSQAQKVDRWTEKKLLKDTIRHKMPHFPSSVIDRKKSPMPPPLETQQLRQHMIDALHPGTLYIEQWFDRKRLQDFLQHTQSLNQPHKTHQQHYALYRLYFLERWCQIYLNP